VSELWTEELVAIEDEEDVVESEDTRLLSVVSVAAVGVEEGVSDDVGVVEVWSVEVGVSKTEVEVDIGVAEGFGEGVG